MVGGASIGGVAAIFKLASLLPERAIFAYGGRGRGAAALSFPRLSFQESFPATMAIVAALRVPRGRGNCRRVRPSPRMETDDACWQPGQKSTRCSFSVPVRQTAQQGQLNSMNQTCVKPGPTHLRTSDQCIEEVTGCDQKRTESKLVRSAEYSASEGNHWAGRTYCLPGCAARSMALAISPRPPVLSEFD